MPDYTTTAYGFDWGPLSIERAMSDPRYGYALQVKVGDDIYSIESSPQGRRSTVTKHLGKNKWAKMEVQNG